MTGISNSERSPVAVEPRPSNFVRQLRWASIIISLIVICLGCSVILGWLLDLTVLKSIIPDRVAMSVTTAVGIVLGGISLLLWHQRQKRSSIVSVALYLLPSLAIACSLISLIDFATGSLSYLNSATVRMSPNTAVSLLCFNIAILLLLGRFYLIAQLLALLVAAIASVSLIGHIYDIASFYRVDPTIGMAIHTAVSLILLAVALLGTCSTRGWMRVITREEAGGIMARWLLPVVIIIPPLLGGIFWKLFLDRIYDIELIVAPRILLEMSIFGSIVWWNARKLNHSDRQKQHYYRQLLETEARFHAIFDRTFQFTGLLDPEGTVLEANQTFLDFGGISKSDVINQPFWSAYWWQISPQTQQDLRSAIAHARTGKFVRYPVEVQGKDKQIITIDFSLRPILDSSGQVVLIILEGRDISEQIKVKRALQASEARYKAIVEDQTELICRYRSDSTISYVNDAFCRYFDLNREQLIDREYTPVIYEADRPRVTQLVSTMNSTNPTVTVENRVVAKTEIRWTQWNNRMIFNDSGFIEYQAVGRDITPLKETETRLRESEEKFRRAFEDAAIGKALASPDGKFIQVNRSLCEFLGYSETELLGKTFASITHPDDRYLDLSYARQMLAGNIRVYQTQKRYLHKLGYVVWALLNVSLVKDLDGKPRYFIAQVQDINQRKRAEARLHDLVTELERSNQELEEFARVVSHDLLSPLRKQLILLDLLLEEYDPILDEKGQQHIARIIRFNSQMENLVRSLLTYARVTTQAHPFVKVALNEVIDDVLQELEPEITQIDANITVAQLPTIKGDRRPLRQLFFNLLQNALKFHSRDRVPQIEITYRSSGDRHQILVTDNGIGFDPQQKSKIFAPFHRLHSQSKYKGTGLGLAICEKIVRRHGGAISARSVPNEGTTFTISLPNSDR